jgi:hypothetical protein
VTFRRPRQANGIGLTIRTAQRADLDLLGFGDSDPELALKIFREVCATAFVSKNARGQSSLELNSQNERLWNGCLWRRADVDFWQKQRN